jgi:hypothetical protein
MERRTFLITTLAVTASAAARAHHGWSGFDTAKPLYLEGKIVAARWANPHAELELEPLAGLKLPADLAQRSLPAQQSSVDTAAILGSTRVPDTPAARWTIELAPLTRMQAWQVTPLKAGDTVAMIGYGKPAGQGGGGAPVMRVEYLFADGKAYGLRSLPA